MKFMLQVNSSEVLLVFFIYLVIVMWFILCVWWQILVIFFWFFGCCGSCVMQEWLILRQFVFMWLSSWNELRFELNCFSVKWLLNFFQLVMNFWVGCSKVIILFLVIFSMIWLFLSLVLWICLFSQGSSEVFCIELVVSLMKNVVWMFWLLCVCRILIVLFSIQWLIVMFRLCCLVIGMKKLGSILFCGLFMCSRIFEYLFLVFCRLIVCW